MPSGNVRLRAEKRGQTMKFEDPKFPWFKMYVSSFGKLTTNRTIVSSLVKWGKMAESDARAYMIGGNNPEIRFVDLTSPSTPSMLQLYRDFPWSVTLDISLLSNYENTAGRGGQAQWVTGAGLRVPRVGVAMLESLIIGHLRVFSLDDEDRVFSNAQTSVLAFENEVYGRLDAPQGTTW
jgi:hypothetical protein